MQLTKTSYPVAGTVSCQIDPEQTELEDDSIPRPVSFIDAFVCYYAPPP